MLQHIKTDAHRTFVSSEKNFISLDMLIARGPNMEQFLNDVIRFHDQHKQEGLEMRYASDKIFNLVIKYLI